MILEKQKESFVLEEGSSQETIGMSLDLESANVLMQMLSKNLYSDAIGSTIRECASNALDSHRRAGVTDPIIVSLLQTNNSYNYEFTVEDFGTGLDANDVQNIISKYGKSTKRDKANELGMMGLGFKAPLAYSSSFYFVCRKDGIERKYMMYEGEDGNAIDPLYETPTNERNGVKIIIPINYSERLEFIEKIKEQLAYFENVYFNVSGIENDKIKITRNEHFQHSTLVKIHSPEMHVCLDNVYYPIDYEKLGINRIRLNLGLRFTLSDGLFPTPNRESLRYTKEAKQVILNKIANVADYLVEKYNSTVVESENIFETLPKFGSDKHYLNFELGNWEIDDITQYSNIKFKLPTIKGVQISDLRRIWKVIDYLLSEYKIKYEFRKGKFKATTNRYAEQLHFHQFDNNCYKFEDKLDNSFKRYFRETFPTIGKSFLFAKRENSIKLGRVVGSSGSGYDNYIQILELKNYPKREWRKRIQECQFIMSKLYEQFKDADKYEIPKEWFEKKTKIKVEAVAKRKERIQKLSGEVSAKELQKLDRYVDKNRYAKAVPVIINLAGASVYPKLTVYGDTESLKLLEQWYSVSGGHKNLRFLVFSDREIKKIKDLNLHNWIKIEDFMKGDNKPFKRAVTAEVICRFINKYEKVFSRTKEMSTISRQLSDKMSLLYDYVHTNHLNGGSNELYDVILAHAEENNLFDQEIYTIYKELNTIFSKLPFLIPMFSRLSTYGWNAGVNEFMPCIQDLFRYYKQRMNWENYVKLNEEIENVEKTEITEELVEQSI